MNRRSFVAALSVLVAAGLSAPARAAVTGQVLEINATATGFSAPATASPGVARFHATTTDAASGWIGLARLKPGVTWETFRENLAMMVSDTPADVVTGSAGVARTATLLGGVVIHPGQPGEFTQGLGAGRYVLFDYRYLAPGQDRYRYLDVGGPATSDPLVPAATLVAAEVPGAGPRFELQGTPRAGQPLGFRNAIDDQCIEAVLFPIGPDVTDERLRTWFAAFQDGSGAFPPDPPFDLEQGLGTLPLSPGVPTVTGLPLSAGRYVVVDWLKDARTGTRLVKQGHYLVLDVR
jgi:hypothetical protein